MLYKESDSQREYKKDSALEKIERSPRGDYRRDYARLIHSNAFRRLVGKTQLFPGIESDFFRNRLTHSLEVAQVAKTIARKLNCSESFLKKDKIDEDLVETAGLAHDLGHPPFGHNGEMALDCCMQKHGGFEGNAQTLRILSRLEKKVTSDSDDIGITKTGVDKRYGLNLTYRTLASILKYDSRIPIKRTKYNGVQKGYYSSESDLVAKIKKAVTGKDSCKEFKTVECQIMDIADDIAYSTYDLEDALKAGFLKPLDLIAAKNDFLNIVCDEINSRSHFNIKLDELRSTLLDIFSGIFDADVSRLDLKCKADGEVSQWDYIEELARSYQTTNDIADVGYLRTAFTSDLVNTFVEGVRFTPDRKCPGLSKVYLDETIGKKVEVLKRFTYVSLIISPRLAAAKVRGKEIVKEIYERICKSEDDGYHMLPIDFRVWYERFPENSHERHRLICDFIAGMTDRYAVEFYFRLKSENPATIFKPI